MLIFEKHSDNYGSGVERNIYHSFSLSVWDIQKKNTNLVKNSLIGKDNPWIHYLIVNKYILISYGSHLQIFDIEKMKLNDKEYMYDKFILNKKVPDSFLSNYYDNFFIVRDCYDRIMLYMVKDESIKPLKEFPFTFKKKFIKLIYLKINKFISYNFKDYFEVLYIN